RFSTPNTFMWFSPCRRERPPLPCRTRRSSMIFYFGPPPRHYEPSPPIPNIWAPRSAFSASSTLGGRISCITLTYISSCPAADCHLTGPGGSLVGEYFLPVEVLSCLFRRLFIEALQKAYAAGQLQFFSALAQLKENSAFQRYLAPLRQTDWVVYAKPPFAGPEQVLDYVGRYTHRVAISNNRILDID